MTQTAPAPTDRGSRRVRRRGRPTTRQALAARDADRGRAGHPARGRAASTTASFRAVKDISIDVRPQQITALIGPSGCGKSTLLRSINRMNDLIPGARVEGQVLYHGEDLYGAGRRPGRGPPADRDGVPEAEPVPEVDLRQRRLRAADQRLQGQHGRARRAAACAGRRSGTRSRTSSSSPGWRCRAASSSACASPGRSPPSPR